MFMLNNSRIPLITTWFWNIIYAKAVGIKIKGPGTCNCPHKRASDRISNSSISYFFLNRLAVIVFCNGVVYWVMGSTDTDINLPCVNTQNYRPYKYLYSFIYLYLGLKNLFSKKTMSLTWEHQLKHKYIKLATVAI